MAQNLASKKRLYLTSSLILFSGMWVILHHAGFDFTPDITETPLTLPEAENKSQIAASTSPWHSIPVRPGSNLTTLLQPFKIGSKTIHDIMQLGKIVQPLTKLRVGDRLLIQLDRAGRLSKLTYAVSARETLKITQTQDGWSADREPLPIEKRIYYASGIIESSLVAAGTNSGLREQTVFALADIFAYDIDFAKDLRRGDTFTVIYEAHFIEDQRIEGGHIVAAEFVCRNQRYQAIRYTLNQEHSDYFRPNGQSVRTAFLRTPVKFTRISSHYSTARKHPILLHTIRGHHGVDYAAPVGTEVKASGRGVVSFIGNRGGYGRMIELKHRRGYSTRYAHLSRYQKGLKVGSTVQQGQIIGFVGQSGLANGPHLHYEFRINGRHVNPQTVKLPQAEGIPKRLLPDFQAKARPLLAQLSLYGQATHYQA